MSSDRAKQLVEAGLWLRLSGDGEGAARLFEQALRVDPSNAKAREYLARDQPVSPIAEDKPESLPARPPQANPFVRRDPPPPAPVALQSLDGDWGAWAAGPESPPEDALPGPVALPQPDATFVIDEFVPELTEDASSAWDTQSDPGVHLPESAWSHRDALDLVIDTSFADVPVSMPASEVPPPEDGELQAIIRGIEDLLELDDHSGAMELLGKAHELAPYDQRVQALKDRSERVLLTMLESKLGDMNQVPRVQLQDDDIIWLNLDHRAGFVLAQIDGTSSYDDLFALSGMTRLDTARILGQLLDEGVIAVARR